MFYLDLSFGNWTEDKNDNNNLTKPSIFVTEYKNSITDNTSYSLETLYNEEIILFTGNAFKLSNDNNKIVLNNIICKGFKTIEGKLGLQF